MEDFIFTAAAAVSSDESAVLHLAEGDRGGLDMSFFAFFPLATDSSTILLLASATFSLGCISK